ncbi:alpha-N-acetylgalactosaminide alpha-2,6-sialyltransferase 2 isoform X2 [Denticeps clupeoides]|uniref:alpha-N-acetylgalactosaminide alpha-2,6-sialyltransferase n=1 Tax=Denticeps clupeoides TaxID=299321 RepID=A0AAY4AQ49_9TELE|nr:alpha-N-acetylgalactosaminide alpha-2,6-sialyltransferase 2-like isoform X2 [Denticeps clupeoides]
MWPRSRWMCLLVAGAVTVTLFTLVYGPYRPRDPRNQPTFKSPFDGSERSLPLIHFMTAPRVSAKDKTGDLCSVRQRVERDGYLKQYFNFSVPVLQWAGSFNQSEWQRLHNFIPPYGWGGLPYRVVMNTLRLLAGTSSGRLFESSGQCVSCAVVGNGGILRGSKQGKAIDSHQFVFRVNGAVTKGFEEDVGNKTSFYGFTTNTMKNSLQAYHVDGFTAVPQNPSIKYIFIPSHLRDYEMLAAAIQGTAVSTGADKGDWPSKYFGNKRTVKKMKMLHPDFITYVTMRFLRSSILDTSFRDLYMPSTGALMLLTALHTCDKVSAFGFITRNYNVFSDHYFDSEMKPLFFFANHDMVMESRLWELLHFHEVLWLYQRM